MTPAEKERYQQLLSDLAKQVMGVKRASKLLGMATQDAEKVLRRYGIDMRKARKTARYNAKMAARARTSRA